MGSIDIYNNITALVYL